MSKKLQLTGLSTFTSPLTYGKSVKNGQIIKVSDADSASLQDIPGVFTLYAGGLTETYDFTDDANENPYGWRDGSVVIQPSLLAGSPHPPPKGVLLRGKDLVPYGWSDGLGGFTPSGQDMVAGAWNGPALHTFDKVAPVGVNSYDLIRRKVIDPSYSQTNILDWVQASGGNLIRVMYPGFGVSDYTNYVFAAGIPATREFRDTDMRQEFLAASDGVFDAAAARGLGFLLCMFFSPQGVCDIAGETIVEGLQVGSDTHSFMQRFTRWTALRYANHPAFFAISFMNEITSFEQTGAGYPTAANIGALFTNLADIVRGVTRLPFVTSDLVFLSMNTNATRPTYETALPWLKVMTAGLDVIGLHAYGKGPSQSGYSFSGVTGGLAPGLSTNYGFEGFPSMACGLRNMCDLLGKPLMFNETGVPNDVEDDAERYKKDRCVGGLLQYARVALLWDVADLPSPQSNQVVWQIRPGTTRGNTYLAVASDYNKGRAGHVSGLVRGAGTIALKKALQPKSFFQSTRTAGATLSLTSTAAMTSLTQALAVWVRRDAALNNFEILAECRGAGNLSGFALLEGAVGGTNPLYCEFRGASGATGNTSGVIPISALGEWVHLGFVRRVVGATSYIEVWVNGMFWNVAVISGTYVGIPAGTVLRFCGGSSSGAPVSMQDFCFAPFLSPEDIWAHMRGEVPPQAQLCLRAMGDTVLDVSRGAVAVTVGAGVTVRG